MLTLKHLLTKAVRVTPLRAPIITKRSASSGQHVQSGPGEAKLRSILEKTFPKAKLIEVEDISGGCGAMFEISVEAPELKGLSIVKQHRMVNEALREEIKDMHGLRIHTSVPP